MKGTLAIYPGSFNPFTVGHQNILEKAEAIFGADNVLVAVGLNPEKTTTYTAGTKSIILYDDDSTRVKTVNKQLSSKTVEGYIGFLTEYVREKEEETGKKIVIIRGLRNGHDFDYEYNQLRHIWDQYPSLPVISLFADPVFMHVSSSAYRSFEKVKPSSGHHMLAVDRPNPLLKNEKG